VLFCLIGAVLAVVVIDEVGAATVVVIAETVWSLQQWNVIINNRENWLGVIYQVEAKVFSCVIARFIIFLIKQICLTSITCRPVYQLNRNHSGQVRT